MIRVLRLAFPWSLALGTLLAAGASPRGQDERPRNPGGPAPVDATLDALLAAHNKVRAAEKLPPLKLNPKLARAARDHARDMAEHALLSHDGSDGSDTKTRIKRAGYHYQTIGENVAAGQESVADAMRGWIESPPHRENLLGPFTEMGGGVEEGTDGRKYWCVDFGRPMAEVDPAKGPDQMVDALNRARAAAKKKRLTADPELSRVAARFARLSAEARELRTRDRDGKSPFDRLQAEGYRARKFGATLASGEGDPGKVVASWLERPQDRDALLSGFERAGVGVATDPDGVPYWVLLLARGAGP